jgi:release factor glutamine methyltransferase
VSVAEKAKPLAAVLRDAGATLRVAGVETPELDARVLAAYAIGVGTGELIAASREPLDPSVAAGLRALIARRADGEPVARILGRREFWGLDFALNQATLVPRPDSETLIEAALELVDRGPGRSAPWRVADLGTGSGCLLISLLMELPAALGVGTDISAEALGAARANTRRHGVDGRAAFVVGSWAEALAGVDVMVANPPYIAGDAICSLAREVARHEPRTALDGGRDGLNAYRALLPTALRALAPEGVILVEIGAGQEAAVGELIEGAGLARYAVWPDLAGTMRVLAARRRA